MKGLEYSVTSFKDQWNGNGDGETEINMTIELPQKDIDNLISHGAKPLPIVGPENKKRWLERISGIDCATDGVYFFVKLLHQQILGANIVENSLYLRKY